MPHLEKSSISTTFGANINIGYSTRLNDNEMPSRDGPNCSRVIYNDHTARRKAIIKKKQAKKWRNEAQSKVKTQGLTSTGHISIYKYDIERILI